MAESLLEKLVKGVEEAQSMLVQGSVHYTVHSLTTEPVLSGVCVIPVLLCSDCAYIMQIPASRVGDYS